MSTTRRDFLRTGAVAAAATLAAPHLLPASPFDMLSPHLPAPRAESYALELAAEALGAAKDAGAFNFTSLSDAV